jgi:hypothetical protein
MRLEEGDDNDEELERVLDVFDQVVDILKPVAVNHDETQVLRATKDWVLKMKIKHLVL